MLSLALEAIPGPLASCLLLVAALPIAACEKSQKVEQPSAVRTIASANLTAKATANPVWHYEVSFEAGRDLAVLGSFEAGGESFSLDDHAAAFVHDLEFADGAKWSAAKKQDSAWHVPCSAGCRIRYRFALRDACESLAEADTAIAAGGALIAPPSTWLLHPDAPSNDPDFELHVEPGPGARFVTAFHPAKSGQKGSYRAATSVLDDASYAAFGALEVAEVPAGDTTVQLAVAPDGLGLDAAQAQAWIAASAGALASYYGGHLPARHSLVLLMKGSGDNTRGLTLGGGGPGVLVRASDLVNPNTTRDDWVVTHELIHANFPDIGRGHSWFSEGMATYIEPIARARVGLISEEKVWRDLMDGLPKGLPQAGDQGLENTRTWGRTYWGGALFCLVADVTLRERTGNQHSLDDILLAIGKTGASDEDHWSLSQVLDAAQSATGTPVLREVYAHLAEKPGNVDLAELFARLGVRARGASVVFDDAAPLAKIRHSIAARRPG